MFFHISILFENYRSVKCKRREVLERQKGKKALLLLNLLPTKRSRRKRRSGKRSDNSNEMFLLNKTHCCCQEWQTWLIKLTRSKMKVHVSLIAFCRIVWTLYSCLNVHVPSTPPLFTPHFNLHNHDHLVQATSPHCKATSPCCHLSDNHLQTSMSPHYNLESNDHHLTHLQGCPLRNKHGHNLVASAHEGDHWM